MKTKFKLLPVILMLALFQSCVPEDQVPPDTGDVRDKYVGTWLFIDYAPNRNLKSTFAVVITLNPNNSSQVLLSNFGNPGSGFDPAYGIATSGNITVPSQNTATDWLTDGSGTLTNASTMSWSYSITAGGTKTTYQATATKQ